MNRNVLWVGIPVVFIVLAIIFGLVIFREGVKKQNQQKDTQISQVPEPTQTISPTPTVTVEIDFSKYSIRILNGSGVKGEANKLKSVLEEQGFKVESIGNADNSNYIQTVVRAKKDIPEQYISKLKGVLESAYSLSSKTEENVGDESVVVIVGVRKQ